jgi:hypothetical protein
LIGTKVVCHARYVAFQMTEVVVPKTLFAGMIDELRLPPLDQRNSPSGCREFD